MNSEILIEQMNKRKKFKIMVSILGGLSNIDIVRIDSHNLGEVIVKKDELVKKEYYILLNVWQSQNRDGSWGYHSQEIDFNELEEFVEREKQSIAYLNYLGKKLQKELEAENGYYKDF